ncbi:MAG: hypothetical protein JWP69_2260 [Flaviaesturariibacter sp.]|nr:hypothetical protein [Flaviaesturariibacter sp.]
MKATFLMPLTVLCLFFSACDRNDDDDSNGGTTNGTDPRANSTWVYKVTQYNEAGATIGSVNMTLKGVEVTLGGATWLNMVDQSTMQPVIALRKNTDGWWYLPYPGTATSLWFKYPATVNETYPYVYGTCTVKNINESVTVPAGAFTGTYMVEGHDTNSLEDEFWFTTSGAVLVKFNTYDQKAAGPASNVFKKQSLELVSYTR